jgi:hypothetical protein
VALRKDDLEIVRRVSGFNGLHCLIAFVFVLTRTNHNFEIFLRTQNSTVSQSRNMSSLQYKKVLVLGATSGIGWALAAKVCICLSQKSY